MPRITANADTYAATRQNMFFPCDGVTGRSGYLDGQCVTLVKWFMAEMSDVPNPFGARGDARYVGRTLVAQGHAVEVPYSERRRGDIITNEYGTYGHIYVQLSGGRVFEENANFYPQVQRKIVDGSYVYASRIGSEGESFRHDIHVYRLKTYKEEGSDQMIIQNADNWYGRCAKTHWLIRGRDLSRETFNSFVGQDFLHFVEACSDDPEADRVQGWQNLGAVAARDDWQGQINRLTEQLNGRPTKEDLAAAQKAAADLQAQIQAANDKAAAAEKKAAEMEVEHIESQKAGNAFLLWLGEQIKKLIPGGK